MSTFTIKLRVTAEGSLEIENKDDKYIEAAFGQVDPPSILYKENTVSLPNTVKSLNASKEVTDDATDSYIPQPENNYSPYGNVYNLDVVSIDNNLFYIFEELAVTSGTFSKFYIIPLVGDKFYKLTERLTFSGNDSVVGKRYAEVQNSVYFIKDLETKDFVDNSLANPAIIGTPGDNQLVKIRGAIEYEYLEVTGMNFYDPDGDGNTVSGIAGIGNYLLVWNKYRIWWSSPLDVTNFDPSGASGAGNALITAAKGIIVTIEPTIEGFIVFCRDNIVSARYSGDSENPWIFREVVDGGGVLTSGNKFLVNGEKNKGAFIAYTTKGLQLITPNKANTLPDSINRFVSGNTTEIKNPDTGVLESVRLSCNTGCGLSAIKSLYFDQGLLFIYFAATAPDLDNIDYSKLIVYNLDTGAIDFISGDYPVIVPRRNPVKSSGSVYQEVSLGLMPKHFSAISRVYDNTHGDVKYRLANRVLDLTVNNNTRLLVDDPNYNSFDMQFPNKPAVLLFELGLNPETEVEVHSVQLVGTLGNTSSTRPTVKIYSNVYGLDTPQEFIYHESSNKYYGYACGRNLRIELSGRVFNISSIDLEISKGASS